MCCAALAQIGITLPHLYPKSPASTLTGKKIFMLEHMGTKPVTFGQIWEGHAMSVYAYGAKCDGVTDDSGAINNALKATGTVIIPNKSCYVGSTIKVPGNAELVGETFLPMNPPYGSTILCGAAVSPCVQIGNTMTNYNGALRKLIVSRNLSSTPSASLVGIQIYGYNNTLEDVMAYNHGVGYYYQAEPSTGQGLGSEMTRCYGGKISDAYIVLDGWPEMHMMQCRLGMNGLGDYGANAFIRFQGGLSGSPSGPNGLIAVSNQFNQGSSSVAHFLEFVNLGSGGVPAIDAIEFMFNNNHIENIGSAEVYSDSTWMQINQVWMIANEFNDAVPFFNMNAATSLNQWHLSHNVSFNTSFAPSSSMNTISIMNIDSNEFNGPVTLGYTGVTSGDATFRDNKLHHGATLTGTWNPLVYKNNVYYGGSLSDSAGGVVYMEDSSEEISKIETIVSGGNLQSVLGNQSTSNNSVAQFALQTGIANTSAGLLLSTGSGFPVVETYWGSGDTGGYLLTNAGTTVATWQNGLRLGAVTGGDPGNGGVNAINYWSSGSVGVTCSGRPSASFASVKGIVTHC
jgi:hypothetical protein